MLYCSHIKQSPGYVCKCFQFNWSDSRERPPHIYHHCIRTTIYIFIAKFSSGDVCVLLYNIVRWEFYIMPYSYTPKYYETMREASGYSEYLNINWTNGECNISFPILRQSRCMPRLCWYWCYASPIQLISIDRPAKNVKNIHFLLAIIKIYSIMAYKRQGWNYHNLYNIGKFFPCPCSIWYHKAFI